MMAIVRRVRPPRDIQQPRRILLVQLDHLGDAVLSTPLIAELRAAYPDATIDVLASPSNHEVFEADPHVNEVRVAERTWFERRPDRWGLLTAVWKLGWSLRKMGYDLGIDVRGDVLTVLVLVVAGVPRRLGWSMGGGAFLLTDVAPWIPGRHEVRSRLALLDRLGLASDDSSRVDVHISDADRIVIARRLAEAWPRRSVRRAGVYATATVRVGPRDRPAVIPVSLGQRVAERRTRLAACGPFFGASSPSCSAPRGWERGQALAAGVLEGPDRPISAHGLARGGGRRRRRHTALEDPRAPRPAPRLDRQHERHADDRAFGTGRRLHRLGFRPGSPGGLGGHSFGHPFQRDQSAETMAAVVATFTGAATPRRVSALPPEGLPARRPPLHVGAQPRASLSWCRCGYGPEPIVRSRPIRLCKKRCRLLPRGQFMPDTSRFKLRVGSQPDWRGWLLLIWVIGCGWAYALMVLQARAPQALAWLASRTFGH